MSLGRKAPGASPARVVQINKFRRNYKTKSQLVSICCRCRSHFTTASVNARVCPECAYWEVVDLGLALAARGRRS